MDLSPLTISRDWINMAANNSLFPPNFSVTFSFFIENIEEKVNS